MKRIYKILASCLLISISLSHAADSSDMNKSNNPLTPMLGLNFQDYLTSSLYGSDKTSNSFFLRGVLPHKTGGVPQLMRATLPYLSVPDQDDDHVHGIGDVNIFDIFLLEPKNGVQFGVGPYFILPTASKTETGADMWQAGLSGTIIKPGDWGMLGALLTYQHSFAGPSENPTQNLATLQPFFIYNLPKAFYVRSSGVMNFNWANGKYYVPIGAGAGKIWKTKKGTVVNVFVEPQWTVLHEGDGQPQYQTFVGVNFQFPME